MLVAVDVTARLRMRPNQPECQSQSERFQTRATRRMMMSGASRQMRKSWTPVMRSCSVKVCWIEASLTSNCRRKPLMRSSWVEGDADVRRGFQARERLPGQQRSRAHQVEESPEHEGDDLRVGVGRARSGDPEAEEGGRARVVEL
jgi:hypothetical protein